MIKSAVFRFTEKTLVENFIFCAVAAIIYKNSCLENVHVGNTIYQYI